MSRYDRVKQRLAYAEKRFDQGNCRASVDAMLMAAEIFGEMREKGSPEAVELQKRAERMLIERGRCLRDRLSGELPERENDSSRKRYANIDLDDKPYAKLPLTSEQSTRRYCNLDLDNRPYTVPSTMLDPESPSARRFRNLDLDDKPYSQVSPTGDDPSTLRYKNLDLDDRYYVPSTDLDPESPSARRYRNLDLNGSKPRKRR